MQPFQLTMIFSKMLNFKINFQPTVQSAIIFVYCFTLFYLLFCAITFKYLINYKNINEKKNINHNNCLNKPNYISYALSMFPMNALYSLDPNLINISVLSIHLYEEKILIKAIIFIIMNRIIFFMSDNHELNFQSKSNLNESKLF